MLKLKQYDYKRYSILLLVIVLIIGLTGVFLISKVKTPDVYLKHLIGITGGIIMAVVVSLIDYHFISDFYIILYGINLVLLVAVKLFGTTVNHSKRWLNLGFLQFQPSELSKIIMIIFLAKVYSMYRQKINSASVILISTIAMAVPTFLILIQTNLSTSIVMAFIFIMILFAAGLKWKIIIPVLAIGIPLFAGLFWYIQQDYQVLLKPYQQKRVLSIIDPQSHPDEMYQQENSVDAIGSGQLYGKAFNGKHQDVLSKDIPISESDFIFSVAGEEFGFIGSCIILLLYIIIIYICLATAKKAPDYLGMLIAIGIASMFAFQVFVNIGVASSILPNTGIPLPFLSSGLSSLISGMLAIGIILNIRLQPRKNRG